MTAAATRVISKKEISPGLRAGRIKTEAQGQPTRQDFGKYPKLAAETPRRLKIGIKSKPERDHPQLNQGSSHILFACLEKLKFSLVKKKKQKSLSNFP